MDWKEIQFSEEETWVPKEGSILEGIYEKVRREVGPNLSNMYSIRQKDGGLINVWGSAGIDSRMELVPIGDIVKIEFEGKKLNEKTGREFNSYKVYVQQGE